MATAPILGQIDPLMGTQPTAPAPLPGAAAKPLPSASEEAKAPELHIHLSGHEDQSILGNVLAPRPTMPTYGGPGAGLEQKYNPATGKEEAGMFPQNKIKDAEKALAGNGKAESKLDYDAEKHEFSNDRLRTDYLVKAGQMSPSEAVQHQGYANMRIAEMDDDKQRGILGKIGHFLGGGHLRDIQAEERGAGMVEKGTTGQAQTDTANAKETPKPEEYDYKADEQGNQWAFPKHGGAPLLVTPTGLQNVGGQQPAPTVEAPKVTAPGPLNAAPMPAPIMGQIPTAPPQKSEPSTATTPGAAPQPGILSPVQNAAPAPATQQPQSGNFKFGTKEKPSEEDKAVSDEIAAHPDIYGQVGKDGPSASQRADARVALKKSGQPDIPKDHIVDSLGGEPIKQRDGSYTFGGKSYKDKQAAETAYGKAYEAEKLKEIAAGRTVINNANAEAKSESGYYAVNGRIVKGSDLTAEQRETAMPVKDVEKADQAILNTNSALNAFDNYKRTLDKSNLTSDDIKALQVLTDPQKVAAGFLEKDTAGVLDALTGHPFTGYSTKAMNGIMTRDQYDKLSPDGQKALVGYFNSIIANFADMKQRLGSIGRNESMIQAEIHTIPLPYIQRDAADEAFNTKTSDIRSRNIYMHDMGETPKTMAHPPDTEGVGAVKVKTGDTLREKGEKTVNEVKGLVNRVGTWKDPKTGRTMIGLKPVAPNP